MLDPAFATRLALGAADLVRHQLLSGGRPFVVNHLVTVRCNLRCPFCYVSGPEQDAWNREHYPRRDELGTAETRAFYRELVAEGFKLAVVLGGEPLLRDDLGELLGELRGKLLVNVFTNGLLLAERHELVRDASTVFVSLDAPDAEHDRIRAHPGLFDRVIAGIEALRTRHPRVRLALNATITRASAARIDDLLALARRLDAPIGFQPPSFEGQFTVEGRPFAQSEAQGADQGVVAHAFRRIRAAAERGDRVIGSAAFFSQVIDDHVAYACHYPRWVLGPVMPNGDVVACTEGEIMANVRRASVASIVGSAAFRDNARAGLTCTTGCRDWGIFDLSAVFSRRFGAGDARRYYRAFVA